MEKFKKEKGITLVALIITIVVLLILAVVAIGAVQDSNIIGHAQNAAGSFNQAKANETIDLTISEETINKYVPKIQSGRAYTRGGVALIFMPDNRCIIIDDGEIEGTYISATSIDELEGYTLNNPDNIEYSEIIIISMDGQEFMGALITQDKDILYYGGVSGKEISVRASGDGLQWNDSVDISKYFK